jgi:hypothetical protein
MQILIFRRNHKMKNYQLVCLLFSLFCILSCINTTAIAANFKMTCEAEAYTLYHDNPTTVKMPYKVVFFKENGNVTKSSLEGVITGTAISNRNLMTINGSNTLSMKGATDVAWIMTQTDTVARNIGGGTYTIWELKGNAQQDHIFAEDFVDRRDGTIYKSSREPQIAKVHGRYLCGDWEQCSPTSCNLL